MSKKTQEEARRTSKALNDAYTGAGLAGAGIGLASIPGHISLKKHLPKTPGAFDLSPKDFSRFKRMYLKHKIDPIEMDTRIRGAHYDPSAQKIRSNPEYLKPSVIAHELGHYRHHKALGRAYPVLARLGRGLTPTAMGAGIYGASRYGKEDPEKARKIMGAGFGAATALGASVYADEALATQKANRLVKAYRLQNEHGKRALKAALRTYAGYPLVPAVVLGATMAGSRKRRRDDPKS